VATATETRPFRQSRALTLHLPILDTYLLREMIGPFLFALAAFFIFWGFNIFFIAADYEINAHAPFFLVLRFVVFRMPQAVPMAFPFASLFAALLAMSRLMGDNEITAMRTSGIPLWRFALTPLLFGVAMFGLCYGINEYISPASVDLSTRTFYQILYRTETLPIDPQFFRKDPDTNNVFYVTQVEPDGKTMDDVQIFKPGINGGRWRETIQAKTATVEGSNMILHDAILTTYGADGNVTYQGHSARTTIGLPLAESAAQFMSSVNNDPWTMSSKTLKTQVQALQAQGMGGAALGNLELNLANKLAWPFACVIAILLALPLALRFGKRGRMLGAALAIVGFFIYVLFSDALDALGRNGAMDPYLAAWLPNVVMGGVGAILFWIEEH
jgi:lipopolysaccharide export system permease protein